ncbi:hypothetical protein KAT95_00765 [Candidatus Parcubacteria bacterium]|nr:hypothetical protein [Candidatus Parcubacteria bacterium]
MLFALIFILLGVIFLAKNLGIITTQTWGITWPCILILIGVWLLIMKYEWRIRKNKFLEKVWRIIEK